MGASGCSRATRVTSGLCPACRASGFGTAGPDVPPDTARRNGSELGERPLERAEWRCSNPWCRSTKDPVVHHVDRRTEAGERAFDLLNLVVLCQPCHAKRRCTAPHRAREAPPRVLAADARLSRRLLKSGGALRGPKAGRGTLVVRARTPPHQGSLTDSQRAGLNRPPPPNSGPSRNLSGQRQSCCRPRGPRKLKSPSRCPPAPPGLLVATTTVLGKGAERSQEKTPAGPAAAFPPAQGAKAKGLAADLPASRASPPPPAKP